MSLSDFGFTVVLNLIGKLLRIRLHGVSWRCYCIASVAPAVGDMFDRIRLFILLSFAEHICYTDLGQTQFSVHFYYYEYKLINAPYFLKLKNRECF